MIQIEGISKSYGDNRALNGVNLEVKKAGLHGIIGPDGAGKTTLMRILMTLLLPDSGKAAMKGMDVVKDFRRIRRITGYMPGRFSLYQDLTVEENLRFFATVFGTTLDANYELIEDIYKHIEPFKKRRAGALSGGMKQKLALSCALIHRPEILILDEPTTGVDAVSRREFWEMLKKLQEREITILVSTPYMDEADLCDRVALMQNGKILEVDAPSAITKRFPHKLIRVRSEDMYRLIVDLRNYDRAESVFAFGQNVHFTGVRNEVTPDDLTSYLDKMGHSGVVAERIEPGIEDVFMKLMNTVKAEEDEKGRNNNSSRGEN